MEKIKIFTSIIVDDTPQCISVLKNLLTRYFPEIKIVGEAKSVKQAVKLIKEENPDIVFLDVEMPGENGVALFNYINIINFETIFTTAFPDYAAQAFRLNGIDYLVKPVKPKELMEAIAKVKNKYKNRQEQLVKLPRINKEDKITFTSMDAVEIYSIMDILYCFGENNYTTVFTNNGKTVVSKTLGYYEELLKKYGFFRANRSYLVNLAHIIKVDKSIDQQLVLKNGMEIPISTRRRKEFFDILDQYTL